MLTATDLQGLEERAKACLDGKSRSYVDDAKVFARIVVDYAREKREIAELQARVAKLVDDVPVVAVESTIK